MKPQAAPVNSKTTKTKITKIYTFEHVYIWVEGRTVYNFKNLVCIKMILQMSSQVLSFNSVSTQIAEV